MEGTIRTSSGRCSSRKASTISAASSSRTRSQVQVYLVVGSNFLSGLLPGEEHGSIQEVSVEDEGEGNLEESNGECEIIESGDSLLADGEEVPRRIEEVTGHRVIEVDTSVDESDNEKEVKGTEPSRGDCEVESDEEPVLEDMDSMGKGLSNILVPYIPQEYFIKILMVEIE